MVLVVANLLLPGLTMVDVKSMWSKRSKKRTKSLDTLGIWAFTQLLIPFYLLFLLISQLTTPTSASFHHVTTIIGTISVELLEEDKPPLQNEVEEEVLPEETDVTNEELTQEDLPPAKEENDRLIEEKEEEIGEDKQEIQDESVIENQEIDTNHEQISEAEEVVEEEDLSLEKDEADINHTEPSE